MAGKPAHRDGYHPGQVTRIKSACLYIATRLGDIMDEVVVVGGLVPSLLINQKDLPPGIEAHAGTMDLDLGLALALLDQGRYQTLTARLRAAGFSQDENETGKPTRQRWKLGQEEKITVDFLIPPSLPTDQGGRLRDIEADFAAVIAPGLHLAFQDRERIRVSGQTIMGENATREVWVCGPGAYVILKALAFKYRGENKDAYDLYYLIRNFQGGLPEIAARLRPLLDDASTKEACEVLRNEFLDHEGTGPRRVAEFISKGPDEIIQADVVGYVRKLLEICGQTSSS